MKTSCKALLMGLLVCSTLFSFSTDEIPTSPEEYAEWKASLVGELHTMSTDAVLASPDISVRDDYVDQQIDRNEGGYIGAWVEGGRSSPSGSYQKILYGYYGSSSNIWTSWVHLNVNGSVFSNRNNIAGVPYFPTIRTHPHNIAPDPSLYNPTGQTNETVWEANGIRLTQHLTPSRIHPSSGSIFYEYKIQNISGSSKRVGLLIFFDTMIATNDAARVSTAFGYSNQQQDFRAPNIPQYWQAYEGPGLGGFVAQGDLMGYDAVMPDRFCIVSWPAVFSTVSWQYSVPVGNSYGDSATMLYWGWSPGTSMPTRWLYPGETWTVATYLGVGGVDTGELSVVANYPDFACVGCRGINPNPFNLDLTVINTGSRNASNVQAEVIGLPWPLQLNSPNPQYTSPSNIPVSGVGTVTFNMSITDIFAAMGNSYTFDVRVTSSTPGIPSNTVEVTLNIPNCSTNGPIASMIRPSPCGGITTCANQDIQIQITGDYGVDPSTIVLEVNTFNHFVGDGQTFWSDPFLTFQPAFPWDDGEWVNFTLHQAFDTTGCPLQSPLTCNFQVDLSPPEVSDPIPANGEVVTDTMPEISVLLTDIIAGVDHASVIYQITVNGVVINPSHYSPIWNGDRLSFQGLTFENGDVVEVCILDAADNPTYPYCPPNHIRAPFCWQFTVQVDNEGPLAEIREPLPNTYSACDDQAIIIHLWDEISDVDPSTIDLTVNGRPYYVDGVNMVYSDTTLIWYPPRDFYYNGQVVEVCLNDARDIYRFPLQDAPICWTFTIDFQSPITYDFQPPPNGVISDSTGGLSFILTDSLAGLDTSSVILTINGTDYTYPGGFTYSGDTLQWLPSSAWTSNDTLEICLYAADLADYCGPNDTSFCYTVYIDLSGPTAEIIEPLPETFTACEDQQIIIYLIDSAGVDSTRGSILVDSVRYTIADSPQVAIHNDTLYYTPSAVWEDGDTVEVILNEVYDGNGNVLQDTLAWYFVVDLSPPQIINPFPSDSQVVTDNMFEFSFLTYDELSGVDERITQLIVNEEVVTFYTDYEGDSIRYSYQPFIPYEDNDTVTVCAVLGDMPDYCAPNESTYCWTIFVDAVGPEVEIIEPLPETYTACEDQEIIVHLQDASGVDTNSVELWINDEVYDTSSAELFWLGDTLIFTPPDTFWFDAETVSVELYASDINGNPIVNEPESWMFYTDFSPPVVWGEDPADSSIVTSSEPFIRVNVLDSMSGLFQDTLIVTVNGDSFSLEETALSYDSWSGQLQLNIAASSLSFEDGDSITVCLHNIMDRPNYCAPNSIDDYCWEFTVDISGPEPTLIEPFDGAYSSCVDQGVIILLEDINGIDPSSVYLQVGYLTYNLDDDELSLTGDTLIFAPEESLWVDGQIVEISLFDVTDTVGNHLQPTPRRWTFTVDTSPPEILDTIPSPDTIVGDRAPTISFLLEDDLSGIDSASIIIQLVDTTLTLEDEGVYYDDGQVRIETEELGMLFSPEDTVGICVQAQDAPDYCPPNMLDVCWEFVISLTGPWATLVEPSDSAYSACDDQGVAIIIEDENGIDPATIEFTINGIPYTVDSTQLSWHEPETLTFIPSGTWDDGQVVNVELLSCQDSLGNPLENPLNFVYIIDLTPPVSLELVPPSGSVITVPSPIISATLVDSLSGIDENNTFYDINGTIYSPLAGNASWSWEVSTPVPDGYLVMDSEEQGITFNHNDTIFVHLTANDNPDYCPPNELVIDYELYVDLMGPVATPVEPLPDNVTSCEDQEIRILLTDSPVSHGVDSDSVVLRINGVDYTTNSPELYFEGDTLVFSPSEDWENNQTVLVELVYAEDNYGNVLEEPLSYTFFVDLEPPVVLNEYPTDGEEVERVDITLQFDLTDNLSGVNYDSVVVSISTGSGGDYEFPASSADLVITDSTFSIDFIDAGIHLFGGDTVTVCVHSIDSPDWCSPNVTDSCWTFIIPMGGPRVVVDEPTPGSYSACDDQEIVFSLVDPNGVDFSTVLVTVQAETLSVSDSELSISGNQLTYTLPSGELWTNGEIVTTCVIRAVDSLGNPMEEPFCWDFIVDLTPPEIVDASPVGTVTVRYPTILVELHDSLSGVDSSNTFIIIDGDTIGEGDTGYIFSGGTVIFAPEAYGLELRGGETFDVCVHSQDMNPNYYGLHSHIPASF